MMNRGELQDIGAFPLHHDFVILLQNEIGPGAEWRASGMSDSHNGYIPLLSQSQLPQTLPHQIRSRPHSQAIKQIIDLVGFPQLLQIRPHLHGTFSCVGQ